MQPDRSARQNFDARILVADDDPLFLDTVARALSTAGFEIITAATGQEACAAIESDKPDLIILDCGLENPSELGIMDSLQRSSAKLPVIILSARRGEWHNRVMQLFGAKSVLVKPVTSEELIRQVCGLLSIRGAYDG
jgi:two-component system OmpR family response regulator